MEPNSLCEWCGEEEHNNLFFSHREGPYCRDCYDEIQIESYGALQQERMEGNIMFADPGGRSALRAATADNPRNLPCPSCGEPNRLTPLDRSRGYQCDTCADRTERGLDY